MSRRRSALAVVVLTAGVVVVAACGGDEPVDRSSASQTTAAVVSAPATTDTTTTSVAPAVTTTVAVPPPAPPRPPPPGPEQVAALQERLFALGYFVSDPRGVDGPGTRNAVMAFQKLHGLERDGVAGPITAAALASAAPVAPRVGSGAHIEVDLVAQVAIVVGDDGTAVAVNATTGKAATPTPPGTYTIFRQVDGWDPGPYGSLYRPKYFTGGIALHGGVPVLAGPASHGCVRLPDPAVDWLWSSGLAEPGTTVVVT